MRIILTLLLVAFWLPASSHALLQHSGLIHDCHADHHADFTGSHEHDLDVHEAADGKSALSSSHVRVPVRHAAASVILICLHGIDRVSEPEAEFHLSGLPPPGTAPAHLSKTWQFSFRTALTARAPSIVS